MGPRAGLDGFGEEKVSCPGRYSKPGPSNRWLVDVVRWLECVKDDDSGNAAAFVLRDKTW